MWLPKDEKHNPMQQHDEEELKNQLRDGVREKIRLEVDEQLRVELANMQAALVPWSRQLAAARRVRRARRARRGRRGRRKKGKKGKKGEEGEEGEEGQGPARGAATPPPC